MQKVSTNHFEHASSTLRAHFEHTSTRGAARESGAHTGRAVCLTHRQTRTRTQPRARSREAVRSIAEILTISDFLIPCDDALFFLTAILRVLPAGPQEIPSPWPIVRPTDGWCATQYVRSSVRRLCHAVAPRHSHRTVELV